MLFLSIKDKCQTYSKAQTIANMSSGNLPTEALKHGMHPHDTTGAKTSSILMELIIKPSCCVKGKKKC